MPMPAFNDDPAVRAAARTRQVAEARVAAIRADRMRSAQGKLEAALAVVDQANADIQKHAADLSARRTAHLTSLERRLPVGPQRATSNADSAVLAGEFRSALSSARGMSNEQRQNAMREALRFSDESMVRGIATAELDPTDPSNMASVVRGLNTGPSALTVLAEARTHLAEPLADYQASQVKPDNAKTIAHKLAFAPVAAQAMDELRRQAPDPSIASPRSTTVTDLGHGKLVWE